MKKSTILFLTFIALFVLAIACVTINIYFPEAAVQKTAEEIVDEVRKAEEEGKKKENKEIMQSSFSLIPMAYAQEEERVSSPKIRALKQSLKDREPLLLPFFEKGNIGEGNDGFIHVRNEDNLSLKEKADLRRLTKDVNSDRENLYSEVANALDIDSGQIPRIQKIFAKRWIENSRTGWWIQKEDDQWERKK
ncbi:MAG: YdbL family protein [Candidatus Aminicenantes bacterium]|nr:YdbL family protein [Candidatus Aminicenantes bacterium]MDH5384014.1 YdbL family protein [Candidatus Aminicenantes bacterium]MDH5744276.1 YdbL family protein [Candidatus Aminicenantes bacterium]